MNTKIISFIFISLAAGFMVLMEGCISTYNTAGIVDVPVVSSDNKYLVAVVAESEALSHQENGGFIQTSYSTSYWLKQYEIATGKLLKKKKTHFRFRKKTMPPLPVMAAMITKYGCM